MSWSMRSQSASVALRRSMLNLTWPGITLRLFGCTWTMPTVPRPWGGLAPGAGHHLLHHLAGHLQRVLAQRHRGGAGGGFHAGDGAVVPADAEHAADHADGGVVVLQHRALLDVRLEVRADRVLARLLRADVADAFELALDGLALGVGGRIRMFEREGFGEYARAHHHRHEARAFFVGP